MHCTIGISKCVLLVHFHSALYLGDVDRPFVLLCLFVLVFEVKKSYLHACGHTYIHINYKWFLLHSSL